MNAFATFSTNLRNVAVVAWTTQMKMRQNMLNSFKLHQMVIYERSKGGINRFIQIVHNHIYYRKVISIKLLSDDTIFLYQFKVGWASQVKLLLISSKTVMKVHIPHNPIIGITAALGDQIWAISMRETKEIKWNDLKPI